MREIKFELMLIRDSKVIRKHIFKLTEAKPGYALIDGMSEVFRQFAGLCDKNGKEIFEGDILKYSRYVDHGQWGETVDGGTVQVTWLDERAGFYPFYVWSSYNDQLKTCEVVGNIYENPELLTQ